MPRQIPDTTVALIFAHIRVWLDQRTKRRQALRMHRLVTRAARNLGRVPVRA